MITSTASRRLTPSTLALALFIASFASAQADPSATRWVNSPDTWSNPLKVCSTNGYEAGTFCFPYGTAYACGVTTTVLAGTTTTLSASFGVNGASVGASTGFTFSQAYTHTAGRCERCQLYICFANSTLQHWDCTCYLDWYEWNVSYDTFAPGDGGTVRPSCVGDTTCPGCQPPQSPPSVGTGPSGSVQPGSGISFDLGQSFLVRSGVPEPGHPILRPHSSLSQLTPWHISKLKWAMDESARRLGHSFQYLMLREPSGLAHLFDLTLGPGPFHALGFYVEEAQSRIGARAPVLVDGGGRANQLYIAAAALSKIPGVPLPGGLSLPLNPDILFELSLTVPGVFQGFQGLLPQEGRALAWINYPAEPQLMGLQFYVSGLVFDPTAQTIEAVSPAHRVTVR